MTFDTTGSTLLPSIMARIQKRIESWKSSKQPVPTEEVLSVANHFFDSVETGKTRGSHHIRITDDMLIGHPSCGPEGDFTIPVSGGQRVKHFYLKNLIELIKIKTTAENGKENESE